MLTCIILCKGFFQGSRLMQGPLQGSRLYGVPAYAKAFQHSQL